MKKYYKIAVYLLILLGAIHCGFTPMFYKTLSADALWFFGSGLSLVFMGLYNLAVVKVNIKSLTSIAIILNFVGTVFAIAITYILREPQAFVALVLVVFIFLNSLFLRR